MASRLKKLLALGLMLTATTPAVAQGLGMPAGCDEVACDSWPAEVCDDNSCDDTPIDLRRLLASDGGLCWSDCDRSYRTPAMIGDFFSGSPVGFRGNTTLDQLMVLADDLDVPVVLPPIGSPLTLTEPGPIGAYSTSLTSVQQIQALLRSGNPLPTATLAGAINEDATLTTSQTISQIQAQLAATPLPYDVIMLQPPPGAYTAAVDGLFQTRNGVPGLTQYNADSSGALIQAGTDTLNGGEDLDAFYFTTTSYGSTWRWRTSVVAVSAG